MAGRMQMTERQALAIALRESLESSAADAAAKKTKKGGKKKKGTVGRDAAGVGAGGRDAAAAVGGSAFRAHVAVPAGPSDPAGSAMVSARSSRMLKELAGLAPWGWDARVTVHPPGAKSLQDFTQVAADVDSVLHRGARNFSKGSPQPAAASEKAAEVKTAVDTTVVDVNKENFRDAVIEDGGPSAAATPAGPAGADASVCKAKAKQGVSVDVSDDKVTPNAKESVVETFRSATTKNRSSKRRVSAFTPGRTDVSPEAAGVEATPPLKEVDGEKGNVGGGGRSSVVRERDLTTPAQQPMKRGKRLTDSSQDDEKNANSPGRKRKHASRTPAVQTGVTPERKVLDFTQDCSENAGEHGAIAGAAENQRAKKARVRNRGGDATGDRRVTRARVGPIAKGADTDTPPVPTPMTSVRRMKKHVFSPPDVSLLIFCFHPSCCLPPPDE